MKNSIVNIINLSKAGEWMRNHSNPIIIVNDKAAIEALRV